MICKKNWDRDGRMVGHIVGHARHGAYKTCHCRSQWSCTRNTKKIRFHSTERLFTKRTNRRYAPALMELIRTDLYLRTDPRLDFGAQVCTACHIIVCDDALSNRAEGASSRGRCVVARKTVFFVNEANHLISS